MEARVPLMIPRQATRGSATTRALVAMMLGLGILGAGSGSALADEPSKLECVQANEAAQSLRQSGKLHDARAQLLVCVATSCPAPVRSDCAERLKEVDKTMPTIIFDVKDKDGIALTAVAVASDGAPLVARLDGTALPVDPGEHVFRFSSEGLPPLERKLVIREGEKDRHEPIALSAASLAEPAAARRSVFDGPTRRRKEARHRAHSARSALPRAASESSLSSSARSLGLWRSPPTTTRSATVPAAPRRHATRKASGERDRT